MPRTNDHGGTSATLSEARERLRLLVESKGGRLERWPRELAEWARTLAAGDEDSRAILKDAEAFDRALTSALEPADESVPEAEVARLTEQILAKARVLVQAERRGVALKRALASSIDLGAPENNRVEAPVASEPLAAPANDALPLPVAPRKMPGFERRRFASALLALSLAIGFVIGLFPIAGDTLRGAASLAGISVEPDQTTVAFDDSGDTVNGDQL